MNYSETKSLGTRAKNSAASYILRNANESGATRNVTDNRLIKRVIEQ